MFFDIKTRKLNELPILSKNYKKACDEEK